MNLTFKYWNIGKEINKTQDFFPSLRSGDQNRIIQNSAEKTITTTIQVDGKGTATVAQLSPAISGQTGTCTVWLELDVLEIVKK